MDSSLRKINIKNLQQQVFSFSVDPNVKFIIKDSYFLVKGADFSTNRSACVELKTDLFRQGTFRPYVII